ncbi:hypothetical protein [Xenorhabdus bharatensis]|uniref:hypothetical protein n=1 Tax=Xenorhabdus bharatensis TaxID=3136256 RepID=UPI0030F3F982
MCQSLSNLIERNSAKFQRQVANAAKVKADIDAELARAEALEQQKVTLIEKGDQLQLGTETKNAELAKLQTRLNRQIEINDTLRRQLAQLKSQAAQKQTPTETDSTGTPAHKTDKTANETRAVDKAASEAITFLKSLLHLESNNIQELATIRTQTRAAIAALNAATVYEENLGLVTDAVNHLSGLLAAIAKSAMAGGQ